ncbi:MAG TPA: glycosyltransferase family 4 protein [Terriglobales bacterium]|nr:glycosyltransferase family 4 protein [Terriglobales bacterium]
MKKKVVHLTSVHSPNDVRILHKECRTLADTGYDVTLIAPCSGDNVVSGVKITGVPVPSSRLHRMLVTSRQIFSTALKLNADVYHFHDPELIPVGLLLKLHGKCVIYDSHENLPGDLLTKEWLHPRLRYAASKVAATVQTLAVRMFDAVIAATAPVAKLFPSQKTAIVQNFPRVEELPPSNQDYQSRGNVAIYVGDITGIRGAVEMVRAMAAISLSYDPTLLMAGNIYPQQLERDLQNECGWERVTYVGFCSRTELPTLLGKARMGLVLLHPVPNLIDAQPVKLFEYLCAGIPIVASDFPLWRKLVDQVGCGLLVNPLKPDEIAEAICWILNHPIEAEAMGNRGREAVHRIFNWDNEARSLLNLYGRILN